MRVCSGPGSQRQSAAEVLLRLPQRLSAHVALAVVRGGIVETDVDEAPWVPNTATSDVVWPPKIIEQERCSCVGSWPGV